MGRPEPIPEFYSQLPAPDSELEEDHAPPRSFPSYSQRNVATTPRVSMRSPGGTEEGVGAGSGRAPVLLSLRPREPTLRYAAATAQEERSALSSAVPITGDIIVLLAERQMRFENEVTKARQLIARLEDSDKIPTFASPRAFEDTREVLTHAAKFNIQPPTDDASSVKNERAQMCRSTQVDVGKDKRRAMSDLSNTCVTSALLGGFATGGLKIDLSHLGAGHNAESEIIRQTGLLLWLITFTSAHVW